MNFLEFKQKYQKVAVQHYTNTVNENPLVSICVQTYQHAEFIKDCLDGILIQKTKFAFEIILGDDASTDGTREICIEYAQLHPDKIRLFLHHRENNIKINGSATGRFNFLYNLYSAQGKYITLCEGDDYWTNPLKLQKQVDFLEANPKCTICFHNSLIFWDDNRHHPGLYCHNQPEISTIEDLLIRNLIPTASVMYRAGLIENFPDWFYELSMGDWPLHILNAQYGKIGYIDEVMSAYRLHSEGIWSSKSKKWQIQEIIKMLNTVKQYIDSKYESIINKSIDFYRISLANLIPIDNIEQSNIVKTDKNMHKYNQDKSILLYTDDPGIYGAGQYNHSLLCGLREQGYKVTCVQSQQYNSLVNHRIHKGIQHLWLDFDTLKDFHKTLTNQAEARSILEAAKPDLIIFSNCCPLSNFAAKQVAIELGIPYVVVEAFVAPYLAERFSHLLNQLSEHYVYSQAVIAVSHDNLSLLHQLFGLTPNKGQVIYYGRPATYFDTPQPRIREQLRQKLGISPSTIVCFTAARLEPVKGYQYQLKAIEQLKQSSVWSRICFIWAGAGSIESHLKEKVKQLGVTDKVKFLGECANVSEWLDASDIFILPSELEGMPLAIMEAMAKGLPVIASEVSGIPEELGNTGKLITDPKVDPQATVRDLVTTIQTWSENPELRNRIGQDCKSRAEEIFREEFMVQKTIKVIENTLITPGVTKNLQSYNLSTLLSNEIDKYQLLLGDQSTLTTLFQIRQQIAELWMNAGDILLESIYLSEIGNAHRLLLKSGICNEVLTDTEQNFVNTIEKKIDGEQSNSKHIQYLLAAMLYYRVDQLPLGYYEFSYIPHWLIKDYLQFLFSSPVNFKKLGEAENYYNHIKKWLDYLHTSIFTNTDSSLCQEVVNNYIQTANFIPVYFNEANLKDIYIKRAEIIEYFLKLHGCEIDYEFPERPANRKKIRLGILAGHFTPGSETFAYLPVYEYLSREFEVILYSLNQTGHHLEQYCQSCANYFKLLPNDLVAQVNTIRADDLDILFIATNVTAVTNQICLLASHRLARIQVTSGGSVVTTGMRHMDYYISGTLTDPSPTAQEYYREKLVKLEGTAHCFSYGCDEEKSTIKVDRKSLGLSEESVIFISGANFFKITPELIHTWAIIIAESPNSVLILLPFGPNWSNTYPKKAFENNLNQVFAKYGISAGRLLILDPQPIPNREDIKEYFKIADVYLDSYPFAGTTSLVEPLQVNLPVIARQGNNFRSAMGAAMVQSLGIPDLVADSEESYIQLAVNLGKNPELRQQKSAEIKEKMQGNPSFLDSRSYSAKIGDLFHELFKNYQINTLNENLRLRDINLIIFPDWHQSEESIGLELQEVIKTLATYPECQKTTLIIDTSNIAVEDAEMFLSSVAMNLLMEEDLDMTEELEISLVGELDNIQWQDLLPRIQARIILENDNQAALTKLSLEKLPQRKLESFHLSAV